MAGIFGDTAPAEAGHPSGFSGRARARAGRIRRCSTPLPDGVRLRTQARGAQDVVVFFATRLAELERRFESFARAVEPAGGLWIAWPKRTANVATDLTENVVRDVGLAHGLVDNKVCAVDDTWSGLRFVYRLADRPAEPSGRTEAAD